MKDSAVMREVARRWAVGGDGEEGLCGTVHRVLECREEFRRWRLCMHIIYHVRAAKRVAYAYEPYTEPMARSLAALWIAHEFEEEGR